MRGSLYSKVSCVRGLAFYSLGTRPAPPRVAVMRLWHVRQRWAGRAWRSASALRRAMHEPLVAAHRPGRRYAPPAPRPQVTRGVLYTREEAEGTRLKNPYDTITEGVGLNRLTANFQEALPLVDGAFRGSDREAVEMAAHLLRCARARAAIWGQNALLTSTTRQWRLARFRSCSALPALRARPPPLGLLPQSPHHNPRSPPSSQRRRAVCWQQRGDELRRRGQGRAPAGAGPHGGNAALRRRPAPPLQVPQPRVPGAVGPHAARGARGRARVCGVTAAARCSCCLVGPRSEVGLQSRRYDRFLLPSTLLVTSAVTQPLRNATLVPQNEGWPGAAAI